MAKVPNEERLDRVERMLARGIPAPVIRRQLAAEFCCARKTVARLIAEVERRWERDALRMSVEDWRTRLTMMAVDCYRSARERGHDSQADRCINTIAKLQGVGASHVSSIVNVYDRGNAAGLGKAITAELQKLRSEQLTAGTDDDKGNDGERN